MSHDAFISYSVLDKATTDATCAALESSGVRAGLRRAASRPAPNGAMQSSMRSAIPMILVFSAHANDSPQIRRKVKRAVSKGIPIIPLRIQDIQPTHSFEYFIATV